MPTLSDVQFTMRANLLRAREVLANQRISALTYTPDLLCIVLLLTCTLLVATSSELSTCISFLDQCCNGWSDITFWKSQELALVLVSALIWGLCLCRPLAKFVSADSATFWAKTCVHTRNLNWGKCLIWFMKGIERMADYAWLSYIHDSTLKWRTDRYRIWTAWIPSLSWLPLSTHHNSKVRSPRPVLVWMIELSGVRLAV